MGLTEEEVARRAGTTRERVREEDLEIVSGLPRQVLVGEVATTDGNPEGVRFEEIGPVPLKGVARPVTVYRALREAT